MQKKTKDCPHIKGTIHSIKNISKQHSQNKTRQDKKKKSDRGALARVQLLIIKTTLSKQEKQKNKTKTDCVDIMFRYRLFVMASKHYQLLWNIVKQSQKFTISREFRVLFIILSRYKTLSILTLLLDPLSSKWLWIFICLHAAKNIPFSKNYYYFFCVCVISVYWP